MADTPQEICEHGAPPERSARFFRNVMWNWLAVGVNLFVALVLSPYIIRKLGDEGYGVWALVFSVVEYFALFDLGLLSAIVNLSARYRAKGDYGKINEAINTGLFYFSSVCVILLGLTVLLSWKIGWFFRVGPAYERDFSLLLLLAGITLAFGLVFKVFTASLEAFQRFDLSNHVRILALILRSVGCVVVLALGFGLVEMGWVVLVSQFIGYFLYFFRFRFAFPELRLSPAYVKLPMLKELAGYAGHSFMANMADLFLNQSPPVIIGYFRPLSFVGYFTLPSRLLTHLVAAIAAVGNVTSPSAAELSATGRVDQVRDLGVYANRYCLTLFMPLSIFLLTYGHELIAVWISATFAVQSAPLLPVLVLGTAIATAGQFNSSSVLFGLGKHKRYAQALVAQAILTVCGILLALPAYGLIGVAWAVTLPAILFRGLFTPWIVCHHIRQSFSGYMRAIYLRPFLTAVPVWALARTLKAVWLPGRDWVEIVAAAALVAMVYSGVAFYTCMERVHRNVLLASAARLLRPGA